VLNPELGAILGVERFFWPRSRFRGFPRNRLFSVDLAGDRTPKLIADEGHLQAHPALSPDGKWLAYTTDEGEAMQVVVRPFPGPGGQTQVSTAPFGCPRCSTVRAVRLFAPFDGPRGTGSCRSGCQPVRVGRRRSRTIPGLRLERPYGRTAPQRPKRDAAFRRIV
jgi:hypothetical protein